LPTVTPMSPAPENADRLISSLRDDAQKFERMAQLIEDLLPTVHDEAARKEWRKYAEECRERAKQLRKIIAEGSAGGSTKLREFG
jgi:hypothetical protein